LPLPIKTSLDDVHQVVGYLKPRFTGATLADARSILDNRLLDGRKMSAYERWGFVGRDGDRIKLTDLGRELGRVQTDDERHGVIRESIRSVGPYRMALEWMHHRRLENVDIDELGSHWLKHVQSEIGSENEGTIREQVTTFFGVAQAAGLGTYIVGRRGHQTRFEVNQSEIDQFLNGVGSTAADAGTRASQEPVTDMQDDTSQSDRDEHHRVTSSRNGHVAPSSEEGFEPIKVFISHSKNADIVDQIKTMLDLADLPSELAVEEETTAIPVPDKVMSSMRRCKAAVICVTADEEAHEGNDGSYSINQNVLIEIGAAFVLYDKRVVLVWDRRLPVPSNLQGLYRCSFEGNELSWSEGIKLMKAVNKFKDTTG